MKKMIRLLPILALMLLLSACGGDTAKTTTPTEEDKANYTELEQQLAAVNEAAAPYTDEDGCVEPENVEKALDAAAAYGRAAMEDGTLRSCIRGESSVVYTLDCGYDMVYIPQVRGMLAGGGESRLVTLEPYKMDPNYAIASGMGDFFAINYYAEKLDDNQDLPGWSFDGGLADDEVTVEAVKQFEAGSCVFWQAHGGYTNPEGSLICLGEKCDVVSFAAYADDLLAKRLFVGTDGHYGVTAAFFETYYEDGDLTDCVFYLGACATMLDDELARTLLKKGADLVVGNSDYISIYYNAQIITETMNRLNKTENGVSLSFEEAIQAAKDKHGQQDSLFGQPYSNAQVIFLGDGSYRLTDAEHSYDAMAGRSLSVLDNDVIATCMEAQATEGDFGYAVVEGQAVLLSYKGSEAELTLPESLGGYPVTAVGQKCFQGNQTLQSVVIPDRYLAIHPYAFYECRNLRIVTLGMGLQTIDRFAFAGSGVSLFRVYRDTLGDLFCDYLGYPDRVTKVEYLPLQLVGNVVGTDSEVYYWRYSDGSLAGSGMMGWYPPQPGVSSKLICRRADGTETVLFEGEAGGRIALAGERIFFEVPVGNYGGTGICSCDRDGGNRMDHGEGELLAVVNGGTSVLCDAGYGSSIDRITVSDSSRAVLAQGRYLTHRGDLVYFQPPEADGAAAACGQVTLSRIRVNGTEREDLYTTAPDLYPSTIQSEAYVANLVVTDKKLYFSYGSVGGTGVFYQGGKIVSMGLDGKDPQVVAGEGGLVEAGFTVDDNGNVHVNQVGEGEVFFDPDRESFAYDGVIYIYDPVTTAPQPLFEAGDYAVAGSGKCGVIGTTCLSLDWAERIGDKAYCLLSYGTESASGSLGWRICYDRQNTTMLCKDMETGQVTVLYTCK